MKNRLVKSILLMLSVVCILCCQIPVVYADTDGTEMQVTQPEQLEIQLGTNWAGVEFQLKTDAGLYPGNIAVGADGVLRLEIGGSSSYILSCKDSSVLVPSPEIQSAQAPATNIPEETDEDTTSPDVLDPPADSPADGLPSVDNPVPSDTSAVAGIPVLHIMLFGTGLLLAVAVLITLRIISKKRKLNAEYEEDDED